ncbi:MAG: IS6 family transposase [Alphaproteobacteria bacterium]|nr:IS6 family transposase [Alphaproteobacteria bacterium]
MKPISYNRLHYLPCIFQHAVWQYLRFHLSLHDDEDLLAEGGSTSAIVTDKLRSYGATLREVGVSDRRRTGGRMNNRAENSYQPTRRWDPSWIALKRPGPAQRLLSVRAAVYNNFNVQRHLIFRRTLRTLLGHAFVQWQAAGQVA